VTARTARRTLVELANRVDAPPREMPLATLRRLGRIALVGVLVLAAAAAWHWRALLDPSAIKALIDRSPAAPLLFVAIHVAASLVFIPRTWLALGAGLAFGMGWGVLWAACGSVAGALAGFLVARYLNAGFIDFESRLPIGPLLQRIEQGGWRSVAFVRLVPFLPHSLVNYAMGLTGLALAPFAWGSLLGQLPMTIACVEFGAAGQQLMAPGSVGWLWPSAVGFAALGVSLLFPVLARRRRPAADLSASEG
jgi:uncharacterized membrane protein YdjX (TVP38/TMEM64 family)